MLHPMRVTLNIQGDLMRRVKKRAMETGTTLTEFGKQALKATVAPHAPRRERYTLVWNPVAGRTLPGIDLADRDSLYGTMERSG